MECSITPLVLKFLKILYGFRSVFGQWSDGAGVNDPHPLPSKDSNEPDKCEGLIVQYFSRIFWRTLFASKQKWNHQKKW